jgi:ubiquinone/menaquinone biosynthesis C-methylase UbiE
MGEVAVSKVNQVRRLFESPRWYLDGTACNIRIRRETVREWAEGIRSRRMLDIGCGDGSISLPLLRADNRLTLLDVSSGMLDIARSNVPEEIAGNVELKNTDLMAADLGGNAYDLIICLGVLAHVDSPEAAVAKIAGLLQPGGVLMLEFTDAFHPVGIPTVLFSQFRSMYRPSPYRLNLLSRHEVQGMLRASNLNLISTFRYSIRLPGIYRLFAQDTLYKAARAIFGTPRQNRNSFLGNQYICFVQKP